jgi:hypothetical protein
LPAGQHAAAVVIPMAATAAGDRAFIIDASRCLYVTQESKLCQKFPKQSLPPAQAGAGGGRDGRRRQTGIWEVRTDNLSFTAESLPPRRRGAPGDAEEIINMSIALSIYSWRSWREGRFWLRPEAVPGLLLSVVWLDGKGL